MDLKPSVLWSLLLDDINDAIPRAKAFSNLEYPGGNVQPPVGCTTKEFAAAHLLNSILKKFQDDIDEESADNMAFAVFHEANNACAQWKLRDEFLGPSDGDLVGEFRKSLYDFFHPKGEYLISLSAIERGCNFGPGSAPGARETSYLDKIGHSILTASSPILVDLFDQYVAANGVSLDTEICRTLSLGNPEIVESVEMTPVPKTAKISRLVKPEPLLNMFFQKGVQRILENRLMEVYGIDLSNQSAKNAELARIGSIDRSFSTIDLKSASDYIALEMCRQFLPKQTFNWLNLLRSAKVATPQGVVELHMMCTMGNAFCFPLQTILFACVVEACYRCLGLPFLRERTALRFLRNEDDPDEIQGIKRVSFSGSYGVFGDDMVVRHEAFGAVTRLLKCLGFIPNRDKSFDKEDGFFRESCGSDWINGTNVRGIYCKSLKREQDRYVLINNLVDWSAEHGVYLGRTIDSLLGSVKRVEVPPWENPDAGIRVPLSCVRTRSVFRATRPSKRDGVHYSGSYLYKRWVPKTDGSDVSGKRDVAADGSLLDPYSLEIYEEYWNPSAILLVALRGDLRRGRVTIRLTDPIYHSKVAVAPCWDYAPPGTRLFKTWHAWYAYAQGYFWSE